MVEWYWQWKTEVLGEKHYTVWVVDGWMSMEQWWNDTDRGKPIFWHKNLSHCHLLTLTASNIQSVPRSKHAVSVIEANQLMLYREMIAVCSQIHTKPINTLCGQNVGFLNVKLAVYIVTIGLFLVKLLIWTADMNNHSRGHHWRIVTAQQAIHQLKLCPWWSAHVLRNNRKNWYRSQYSRVSNQIFGLIEPMSRSGTHTPEEWLVVSKAALKKRTETLQVIIC